MKILLAATKKIGVPTEYEAHSADQENAEPKHRETSRGGYRNELLFISSETPSQVALFAGVGLPHRAEIVIAMLF